MATTMGTLERIWIKRAHRGPMDSRDRTTLSPGVGIVGNADRSRTRQITLITRERWDALMIDLGAQVDPSARRANLLVSGIDLRDSRNRILRVGACRLEIRGETRPCEQMDDAFLGVRRAMQTDWGGGAFAEVLDGGEIHVGDNVMWENRSPTSED